MNTHIELRFLFRGGTERKYTMPAEGEVNEDSLKATVANIINLMKDDDYPIMMDHSGRVLALPNLSELLVIEAKGTQAS